MTNFKKILYSTKTEYIEIFFKVIYLVHLLLSFNVYVDDTSIINLTLSSMLILGGVVLFTRLFKIKLYFNTPLFIILLLFLISFVVSSFALNRYDTFSSLKTTVWMTFQFVILFCVSASNEKRLKTDFNVISLTLISAVSIENIISIIQLFFRYNEIILTPDGVSHTVGITSSGRLLGIHNEPNYAAIYTTAVIILSIFYFLKYKKIYSKIIFGLSILLNYSYMVFSGSRTGLISAIIGIGISVFLFSLAKFKKFSLIKAFALLMVTVFLVYSLHPTIINTYNKLYSSNNNNQTNTVTNEKEEETKIVGRDEAPLAINTSDRRFDIWECGIRIFKENSIYGVGFENIVAYVKDKMPDAYIINTTYNYDSFHNFIIDIMVSQGVIGLLLFCAFIFVFIYICIKKYKNVLSIFKLETITSIAICIAIISSAFTLSHLVFVNTPTTFLFWAYAGYLLAFLTYKKPSLNGE